MNTGIDYQHRATRHRPTDQEALQREIVRLHREQHLSARDISSALCVALSDVLDALREVKP